MHALRSLLPALVALAAVACSTPDGTSTSTLPLAPSSALAPAGAVGQVYTATNATTGNAILAFDRGADGSLTASGSYATNGVGTGAGLGNQGGVTLSGDAKSLFVVNAASDNVSVFAVRPNGTLELRGTWGSGGVGPVSVTESHGLVYVLNAGSGNIAGFRLGAGGLTSIANSVRPVSAASAGAAQVQFDGTGRVLVVTERVTNRISTYAIDANGVAGAPNVVVSSGTTPFGFGITGGLLVVSEAFAGAPDGSAVSSYELGRQGGARVISASVGTTETAACWLVVTGNGRFAYAANAGSASITGYAIRRGALALLDADGVTASTDPGPTDVALSVNSQFLYVLSNGGNSIRGFSVGAQGELTPLTGAATGLPSALTCQLVVAM
ncbi:MAG: beta-propeller fold lactonase family protein [Cytophagaceae bacterium]|nr:beta-propeller fold lactonase family protein [Gemmatimonadaceae bacterium]